MLRSFFVTLSKMKWMQKVIMNLPGSRQASARFVAGETVAEAIAVIQSLNKVGVNATLDFLGENTTNIEDANQSTYEVLQILNAIEQSSVASNVSIKLSQLGLTLDETICQTNLHTILQRARDFNNFIRIDMEDSNLTEATLRIFETACKSGFSNVGLVIQAYLYRSAADLDQLAKFQARIRLCKGAYQEPSNLAYPRKADVDQNYDVLTKKLMQTAMDLGSPLLSDDGRLPPLPALATHDPLRIQNGINFANEIGLPPKAYEFQMLYGIRRDLQADLVKSGHPVRVYVPYGTRWYPYFMRRLAERPSNVWFFVSNLFRK